MILCFSGTGNSRLVADRLAKRLSDRVVMMDCVGFTTPGEVAAGERLVWVFPVHSWGVPKIVAHYMKQVAIEGADRCHHYLVATCGDDCGLTAEMWRSILRRRGWKSTRAAHSVFMPNTYVTLPGFDVDKADVSDRKMAEMAERVDAVAHAIKCSSPIDSIFRGSVAWIKTRLVYPLFMRFLTLPKPFRAEGCIGCGKCVAVCPLKNVRLGKNTAEGIITSADRGGVVKAGRQYAGSGTSPCWGTNCTLCLACYHICPVHAINYGRTTTNKGQWQRSLLQILGKIGHGQKGK